MGWLQSTFPFKAFYQSIVLVSSRLSHPSLFSPKGKVGLMLLKSYTGFSDTDLVLYLNGNIHFQLFCGVFIHLSRPLTNHKIVSAIRTESTKLLNDRAWDILAEGRKPYLELARLHDGRNVLRELFTLPHQPEIVAGEYVMVATSPSSLL